MVETVGKSLRHSCRSELRHSPFFRRGQTMPSSLRGIRYFGYIHRIPASFTESPRIAPVIDLPRRRRCRMCDSNRSLTPKGSVVTGPYRVLHAAEGFPRHYPPADVSSLVETAGVGFAVMSGCSHGITPMQGKFLTRQGISLSTVTTEPVVSLVRRVGRFRRPPYVAAGLGPSHHLVAFTTRQSAYGL